MTKLWKFNKITGYWNLVKVCSEKVIYSWLEIFSNDEPNEIFKISKNNPK